MWIVEVTGEDGEVVKHSYVNPYTAFHDFDKFVEKGYKVKYPYYI